MKPSLELINEQELKINLREPLKRGDGGSTIDSVVIRAPRAKDLEGISQKMLEYIETSTVAKVIQKITTPIVSRKEYLEMESDDYQAVAAALTFFSLPPASRAEALEGMRDAGLMSESATV